MSCLSQANDTKPDRPLYLLFRSSVPAKAKPMSADTMENER